MSEHSQSGASADPVDNILRNELAHGDGIIATASPILRHLLLNDGQGLFSDEVLARVRGMLTNIASQLLFAQAEHDGVNDHGDFVNERVETLSQAFLNHTELLSHAHALAIEVQTAERLSRRSGIDTVLCPLLQELVAAQEEETAELAMHVLAAQARFMQQQRRMELPLTELPPQLFDAALALFHDGLAVDGADSTAAEAQLRPTYDPAARRVEQMARLVGTLWHRAKCALEADHSGISIFATALHMATGQSRDVAILSLGENHVARLALSLRAAGLDQSEVEEQFLFLHPGISLPKGFANLRADQAAALLADGQAGAAH